ncbi:solute carrier family 35 member B1 isoform X2 [Tiliqua scincoides]|uniref:solute carrier family 35 member B1 isoform X2 n=1 Tax=Tiliqua scincoides TaxID=71010 RepID=UPI0034629C60
MAAGTSSPSCCRGGLQPLRATVPFQLQQRRGGDGGRAASVPCAAGTVEKACRNRPPRVRRTSSLDTILGSYLLGQWPRDAEGAAVSHMSDKSTQTPVSWHEAEVRKATSHKRSASWCSMDHRREIAKLKQQLQRTKLSARNSKERDRSSPIQGDHSVLPASKILDVPDGHRAPAPLQRGTGDSLLPRLEHSSSSCSSLSLSPSPSAALGRSPHTLARAAMEELSPGVLEKPMLEAKGKENGNTSPVLAFALSPRPNHTYVFKREPPEGCEKVRAFEEATTRGKYGEGAKQEKFIYALTLVFIQCVINAIFARLLIQFFDNVKVDRTQNWLYAACSLSYLGAMVSSNSALQFVNYPTQVLGKSCKPIPVMLLGVTVLRKKYPVTKYLCVLLIVTGVALFMYKPKKGGSVADDHLFGYGELLLLLSLTLDGLTGVSQDHMRAHYQTGSNRMMLNVNLWSTLFLGAGILFTGELWEFLSFTERYPSIIYNILLFGLTSALGQSFIFMTVVYFGPLTCSIVTTTRKFFTILASVILFANPITNLQWMGTILVFLGLGLDAKFGKASKKTSH